MRERSDVAAAERFLSIELLIAESVGASWRPVGWPVVQSSQRLLPDSCAYSRCSTRKSRLWTDDSPPRILHDGCVPLLACPHCRVWQYAQVSYVAPVSCVACGRALNVVRPQEGSGSILSGRVSGRRELEQHARRRGFGDELA
jgi:hypothetical protein